MGTKAEKWRDSRGGKPAKDFEIIEKPPYEGGETRLKPQDRSLSAGGQAPGDATKDGRDAAGVPRSAECGRREEGMAQGGEAGGGHSGEGGCAAAGSVQDGGLPAGESGERIDDHAENAAAGGGGVGLRFGLRADAAKGNAGGTGGGTESGAGEGARGGAGVGAQRGEGKRVEGSEDDWLASGDAETPAARVEEVGGEGEVKRQLTAISHQLSA